MSHRDIEIRLLGPVEVVVDGLPKRVPAGRGRLLMALLALNAPRVVDTGRIVESVWDGGLPRSPEAALQVVVSRLRSRLGDGVIETAPGGYALGESVVDVHVFEQQVASAKQAGLPQDGATMLRSALAMWRGGPLTGCEDVEFVLSASRTLEERRMSAVEELIDAELACGRHEAVVGDLFGLVDEYPYRERLWGQLMVALYRSGRQAEALATFQRLKSRLGQDLGLEPSPATVELEDRILVGDPSLSPPVQVPLTSTGGTRVLMKNGEVVFRQGDPSDAVYWIVDGRVEVFRESNPAAVIANLGPGRYFGELGPLLGMARSASVRVAEHAVVDVMTVEDFRSRLSDTP